MTLAVPDPRTEIVPPGWFEHVAVPAIEAASWEGLDEAEGRIKAMASLIESFDGDIVDFEKALRVVEKRRGELVGDPGMGRPEKVNTRVDFSDVSSMTASRWRKLARYWDDLLWPHLLVETDRRKVTQTHLLRLITEHIPAKPNVDLPDADAGDERIRLLNGDFRERLTALEPGSVDLIITDPPYPKEDLPLWYDLGQVAAKLLAPRGLLIAYTGQIFLPEVIRLVSESLTYGWTFALMLPGSGSRIMGRHMIQGWKPVVAFSTGTWPSGEWADDVLLSPDRDKAEYEWQQNAEPARRLIERFTAPDGLVVDPFLGVGSFGVAAKEAGRRFVGVELDGGRFQKACEIVL